MPNFAQKDHRILNRVIDLNKLNRNLIGLNNLEKYKKTGYN